MKDQRRSVIIAQKLYLNIDFHKLRKYQLSKIIISILRMSFSTELVKFVLIVKRQINKLVISVKQLNVPITELFYDQ